MGSCMGGVCGGAPNLSGEWDPVQVAAGTWFDLSGLTVYDMVQVRVLKSDRPLQIAIENGTTGKCSNRTVPAVLKKGAMPLRALVVERGKNDNVLEVNALGTRHTMPIPSSASGWVEQGFGDVRIAVRRWPWERKIATAEQLQACQLQTEELKLVGAQPFEKAVVVYKTVTKNKNMIFWMPGRNDTFMHSYVVQPLLDAGLDIYVIEHRKNGRALVGAPDGEHRLVSHVDDFRKYLQEIDAAMSFALRQKNYEKVVLYGHSTGGLEATLFLREGKARDKITHCVLNSPFLDWGEGGIQELLADNSNELNDFLKLVNVAGSLEFAVMRESVEPDHYCPGVWIQYPATDPHARTLVGEKVTWGWVAAVSAMHDALKAQTPGKVPLLFLHTDGDEILDGKELGDYARFVSSNVTKHYITGCRHDMLLNHEPEKNDEVLKLILGWLSKEGVKGPGSW
mmetsp:Transcript_30974/g.78476  ORF Transcript_30974/g.78476 Transcript_30974/m.78476 type:complete len:453 (-) Transcript_30974:30-1388(-)